MTSIEEKLKEAVRTVKNNSPDLEITKEVSKEFETLPGKVIGGALLAPVTVPLDVGRWAFGLFD